MEALLRPWRNRLCGSLGAYIFIATLGDIFTWFSKLNWTFYECSQMHLVKIIDEAAMWTILVPAGVPSRKALNTCLLNSFPSLSLWLQVARFLLLLSFSRFSGRVFFSPDSRPGRFACRTDAERHRRVSRCRSVTVCTRRRLLLLWPGDLAACLLSHWGTRQERINFLQ